MTSYSLVGSPCKTRCLVYFRHDNFLQKYNKTNYHNDNVHQGGGGVGPGWLGNQDRDGPKRNLGQSWKWP